MAMMAMMEMIWMQMECDMTCNREVMKELMQKAVVAMMVIMGWMGMMTGDCGGDDCGGSGVSGGNGECGGDVESVDSVGESGVGGCDHDGGGEDVDEDGGDCGD